MTSTVQWNPEDYARNSQAQLEWARELIARAQLAGSEVVMDVGCGDGRISSEVAQALPRGRVVAIDSSPAFIEHAQKRYPPKTYSNLRFVRMDARTLTSELTFDVIFSNAALHWVDDHPAFLRGVARLLRPSGRLIVSCGGTGNAADVVTAIEATMDMPRWAKYFETFDFPYFFYSPNHYERRLPDAGLSPIRLELVEKDMTQAGREGLAAWLRTTWIPYTQRVSGNHRSDFIADCVDAYLQRYPVDRDGKTHVTMVRLEVEAHPEDALRD